MNTMLFLNRGLATATLTLPNNRRPVSDMSDEQRKAVMAKLGGGGGHGYTGGARGGKRGPARNRPTEVSPEGHARAVRDARIGLQTDLTPLDMLASSAMEEGLDQISQARMNTDNRWVDAALGVAALGLFAAGIKNARTRTQLAKRFEAKKTVDQVLEQMGRDAARFDGVLKESSPAADELYRSYDQLADRVTRARGYPPSAEEANRWLDKVAPRVTTPKPTVTEEVRAFRAETLRTTGVPATDNDVASYLMKTYPESYLPPKNYVPPSPAGDAFRAEAAKLSGSQRGQMLDYARRADQDAVQPRMVKDPWTSTQQALERIDMPDPVTPMKRPSKYDFVTDDPEFYRWYEYGGKPRPKPLTDQELKAVIGNAVRPGPGAEPVRLIRNAVRDFRAPWLANAGPMQEDQRRAMFAKLGGRGRSAPVTRTSSASFTRSDLMLGPSNVRPVAEAAPYLPGSERPARTINFTRLDKLLESYEKEFPGEQGGVVSQMKRLLLPYRENPSAIFDDPKAIDDLYKLIGPAVVGNTGARNYDSKRAAMESSFYSEGLKILHAAGLLTEWKGVSTSGPGGFIGVRFTNTGPLPLNYESRPPSRPSLSPAPSTSSGGGRSAPAYTAPGGGGIGSFNPNQPHVPGQPRVNIDGRPVYGPKPGEPGFIDTGAWRRGALPVVPGKTKPTLDQKPATKR